MQVQSVGVWVQVHVGAGARRAGVAVEPRGSGVGVKPRASSVTVRAVQAQVGCKYEPNLHNMIIFFDLREAHFEHFSFTENRG